MKKMYALYVNYINLKLTNSNYSQFVATWTLPIKIQTIDDIKTIVNEGYVLSGTLASSDGCLPAFLQLNNGNLIAVDVIEEESHQILDDSAIASKEI